MQIDISSDAENDIENAYWFYEYQETGIGDYFRSSIFADIESLVIYGGTHAVIDGFHRKVCKTFPYNIYYEKLGSRILVVAVIGQRENRKPNRGS